MRKGQEMRRVIPRAELDLETECDLATSYTVQELSLSYYYE